LRRMLASINKGDIPKGFRGAQLRDAAHEIRQYVRRHDTPAARRATAIKRAMK
jgi:hypothetical protein